MPIETRIQATVDAAVTEAESRLHEDLHAAVRALHDRITALENAAELAPAPRRGRAPRAESRPEATA